ncbi:CaiB/BaiF CoA transferase family protein [Halorubrum amylolyticum]|uniref:CaiB/BaiF CoA transferase family protein n=1 Tax=Halorubrum amylolyticum TaxID=2508724 RepID=UPI00100905DA|nr:CoA transferase [Halorubrum amylolyticum]
MTTPLSDITILDVTEEYNSYAAKLLGDAGADVIKIERPGGDPARDVSPHVEGESAFFGFLNTSKRSLVLNPATIDDRETLQSLVEAVDIVLEDHLPEYGIDPERLPDMTDTIVISITGFGRSGPYADFESVDLVEAAMGGMAYQTGYPTRPPTRPGLSACSYFGATEAALSALMALETRDRAGSQHVDVSKHEAIAARIESTHTDYTYNDTVSQRTGNKHAQLHPAGAIYEVEDGFVCVCIVGGAVEGPLGGADLSMWEPFCEAIGREDLLQDERFNALPDEQVPGGAKRLKNSDEFDAILEEELADWTTDEFYHATQEAGIANSVVATSADLFSSDQLASRGFLTEIKSPSGKQVTMPQAPYNFSGSDIESTSPPAPNEHAEEIEGEILDDENTRERSAQSPSDTVSAADTEIAIDGALDGIRVLDFTMVWAGPHCSVQLADHGAEVIKVESAKRTEITRSVGPFLDQDAGDPVHGEDRSGYYQTENRGKYNLSVNLQTEAGTELIKEIIEKGDIDVVVESFSPGVMENLGLGYDELCEIKDDLVMCSLSGYGQEGPESHYRAYGPSLEAHSGLAHATGFSEDPPVRTAISFTDPLAGLHGAYAIMVALHHRNKTGEGQYIDLSQREAGAILTHQAVTRYDIEGEVTGRIGNRDERDRIVQGIYRCGESEVRDDVEEWIGIAIRDNQDWEAFADVVNAKWTTNDEFATQDRRLENHDRLDEHIEEWTQDHDRYELMERLQTVGVPAGVVQSMKDLIETDVALQKRGFWEMIDHPVVGEHPYPGALPHFSKTPGVIQHYAPMLGQHTREVLYRLLDISGERVAELEERDVLT